MKYMTKKIFRTAVLAILLGCLSNCSKLTRDAGIQKMMDGPPISQEQRSHNVGSSSFNFRWNSPLGWCATLGASLACLFYGGQAIPNKNLGNIQLLRIMGSTNLIIDSMAEFKNSDLLVSGISSGLTFENVFFARLTFNCSINYAMEISRLSDEYRDALSTITPEGDIILTGEIEDGNPIILRLNGVTPNIIWSKEFTTTKVANRFDLTTLSDGNALLVFRYSSSPRSSGIIKVNATNGNLTYANILTTSQDLGRVKVIPEDNGGAYFTSSGGGSIYVTSIMEGGGRRWTMKLSNENFTFGRPHLTTDSKNLFVTGILDVGEKGISVLKLDKASGNLLGTTTLQPSAPGATRIREIINGSDSRLLLTGDTNQYTNQTNEAFIMVLSSTDLRLLNFIRLNIKAEFTRADLILEDSSKNSVIAGITRNPLAAFLAKLTPEPQGMEACINEGYIQHWTSEAQKDIRDIPFNVINVTLITGYGPLTSAELVQLTGLNITDITANFSKETICQQKSVEPLFCSRRTFAPTLSPTLSPTPKPTKNPNKGKGKGKGSKNPTPSPVESHFVEEDDKSNSTSGPKKGNTNTINEPLALRATTIGVVGLLTSLGICYCAYRNSGKCRACLHKIYCKGNQTEKQVAKILTLDLEDEIPTGNSSSPQAIEMSSKVSNKTASPMGDTETIELARPEETNQIVNVNEEEKE